jgi:inner membrane transporter RhtA
VRVKPPTRPTAGGVPAAVALVVIAVASLQFGAGVAATLFDELGPAGTAFLRLVVAAVVLLLAWRPRLRGRPRADLATVAAFGVTLGVMNVAIYESFARIPLGIAVTIEFVGPLGVAVLGSRRPVDAVWVCLATASPLTPGKARPVRWERPM